MRTIRSGLLVFVLLTFLLPSNAVRADAAPPPAGRIGGPEPFGFQKTEVRMVYERVEMDVIQGGPAPYEQAGLSTQISVIGWFVMHNTGPVPEEMQVIFPLGDIRYCQSYGSVGTKATGTNYVIDPASFHVRVNGIPVETSPVLTEHPNCPMAEMAWSGFEVTFPLDQDVLIRVDYVMTPERGFEDDNLHAFQYVLQTGAGWKGTIGRANIVVHFPYFVSDQNVLSGTTPGYQTLYDEIYWSFQDLEPTPADNIFVAFIRPSTWQKMFELQKNVKADVHDVPSWNELAEFYRQFSCCNYKSLRYPDLMSKAEKAWQQNLAANPEDPRANSGYANFLYETVFWNTVNGDTEAANNLQTILHYIRLALEKDPRDEMALEVLQKLRNVIPDLPFTAPPTFTPTTGPSETPTPGNTITPRPTNTYMPALPPPKGIPTYIPTATDTPYVILYPTPIPPPDEQPAILKTPWPLVLLGFLIVGGGVAGGWWARGRRRH